jgi:RIO kinase 1
MEIHKRTLKFDRYLSELGIRIKDAESRKILSSCLDELTFKTLYNFANRSIVSEYGGVISAGKEAVIFHALSPDNKELAIKIYRIATSDYRWMMDYIMGDHRFERIKRDRKSVIYAWTQKELKNLRRASEAGVSVPRPVDAENNVLVMEFIGDDGIPAPTLKEVERELSKKEIKSTFSHVLKSMNLLYRKAKLVHSDLSEYNILLWIHPVFIDMGAAVPLDHPRAEEFLSRDASNIARFYRKLGVSCTPDKILKRICM